MKAITDDSERYWRPVPLLACNVLALLLLLSWFTGAGQALWREVDARLFLLLNGSTEGSAWWEGVAGAVQATGYAVAVALGLLVLFGTAFFRGTREQALRRSAQCLLAVVAVVLAVLAARVVLDHGQPEPSGGALASPGPAAAPMGSEPGDATNGSIPQGIAAALMVVTAMGWFFAGSGYGLLLLGLSVVLLVPGLAVGAYGLGDHLAGAGSVSLLVIGWFLFTPLYQRALRLFKPPVEWIWGLPDRWVACLSGGEVTASRALAAAPGVALKGFCMGSADVVPGVSGGTMALILGIYERLLGAIRSFDGAWFRDLLKWRIASALARNDLLFLIPLGLGIIAAILFFTRVVSLPALILSHPEIIYGLFFGLILASIVVLMGEVTKYGFREFLVTLLGVAFGLAIVNLVPVETPTAPWFIFLCGFVAICAMLLPGISGSFILLILGKYAYIINALGEFNLTVIVTFSLGAGCGMMAFSRAILWLLRRYHQATLLLIKGVLIGSLWMIWPFQERVYETVRGKQKLLGSSPKWPDAFDATVASSLALMVAGFALVMVIHAMSRRRISVPSP